MSKLSRSHMYALGLSNNWGDYQVLINELRSRFNSQVSELANAWWRQTQELTDTYKPSSGWRYKSVAMKRSSTDSTKFEIHLTLTRQNGYDVLQSDEMWGLGGPPEHLRIPKYEDAVIVVPSDFIETATFKNDILQP